MLEQELRFQGVAFERRAVIEFAASVWTPAQDDPDPERWAVAFIDAKAENVGPPLAEPVPAETLTPGATD